MADPVINLPISVSPPIIRPGQMAVVTIDAFDPDATTGELTGVVTDSQGNVSQAAATLTISDPLTYALEDTDGKGFIITQRAIPNRHVFDVRAP